MMLPAGAAHNGSRVLPTVHTTGSPALEHLSGHARELMGRRPHGLTNRHDEDSRDVTLLSAHFAASAPPITVQTAHHLR